MPETPPKPEHLEDLVSLRHFIDKNEKLLTVIGILFALGIFFSQAGTDFVASFLAYCCFAAALPIFFEVRREWNASNSHFLLTVFMDLFTAICLFAVIFVIASDPRRVGTFIAVLVASAVATIYLPFTRRRDARIRALYYNDYVDEFNALDEAAKKEEAKTKVVHASYRRRLNRFEARTLIELVFIIVLQFALFSVVSSTIDAVVVSEFFDSPKEQAVPSPR